MIKFKHKGNFDKTTKFLNHALHSNIVNILNKYAIDGVNALASATPIDSGITAISWGYEITQNFNGFKITWTNSNSPEGVNVAVLLQYGHATANGGYVEGRDYINPAIRPIFDKIAESAWQEVIDG